MFSTEPVFAVLSQALDATALRHSVHVANIANADVAGYRRLEVVASASVPGTALAGIDAPASADAHVAFAADDVVRLDREMGEMAQNSLRYQALIGAFERATGLLRTAIHEGREG